MPWNSRGPISAAPAATLFLWSAIIVAGQEISRPPPVAQTPAATQTPTPQALVMIDPAHGGIESGALLNPAIPEKDVNLAFAQRLRREFIARGVAVRLLREQDVAVSADERAAQANAVRPALYLTIHSASLGSGVTIFTALMEGGESGRGPFLDWQTAQSAYLERSKLLGEMIANSVHHVGLPVRSLRAPLRPLNNVAAPALAIEIAPTVDIWQLASPEYQQMISTAVAGGVAGALPSIGGQRGRIP
jgi:N-acetylmuramoyl-L-alanine amidase